MRLHTFFSGLTSFLQAKLCRTIYDSWRDAWRRAGCSISDGCSERGNRVCVHNFFNSGDVTAASMEHGRKPQRTWTRALAKRGWRHIPTVMGSEQVKVWGLAWCRVSPMLMVWCLLDINFYDVCWRGTAHMMSVSHFLQPTTRIPQFLEYSCIF